MKDIHGAAIQLNAKHGLEENLENARRLVQAAAERGCQLVVLPELFTGYGVPRDCLEHAQPIPGPLTVGVSRWAKDFQVWLAGSIPERIPGETRIGNTCVVISASGEIVARYRKLHLFDVDLPGKTPIRESNTFVPGEHPVIVDTDFGTLGLAICYDLRFPSLFQRLVEAGAEIMIFPSAFVDQTGRDHWFPLVQARAIENQCFVIAANQCGRHHAALASYGGSTILDPWGKSLAIAEHYDGDFEPPNQFIHAILDARRLNQVRAQLPTISHRRAMTTPVRHSESI